MSKTDLDIYLLLLIFGVAALHALVHWLQLDMPETDEDDFDEVP